MLVFRILLLVHSTNQYFFCFHTNTLAQTICSLSNTRFCFRFFVHFQIFQKKTKKKNKSQNHLVIEKKGRRWLIAEQRALTQITVSLFITSQQPFT